MLGNVVCPRCQKKIVKITYFNGWDEETLDPMSGEPYEVVATERDSVNHISYICSNNLCRWEADMEWKEWYEYWKEKEEEKERAQSKANQVPT